MRLLHAHRLPARRGRSDVQKPRRYSGHREVKNDGRRTVSKMPILTERLPSKYMDKKKSKSLKNVVFQGFLGMVQVTGFPPVAALADKQSTGLFGSLHATLARTNCFRNFLPTSSPVPLQKQKEQTAWSALFVGAGNGT